MSVLSMIMLVQVINPVTALLVPVLFRLAIKSDKVMDYFTYGKYVLLYFALMVAVSFAAVHFENQSSGKSVDGMFVLRGYILLAFVIRFVLGFVYINFTLQRLNSLSKSRLWLILLALPVISPIFSLVMMFWKEKLPEGTKL